MAEKEGQSFQEEKTYSQRKDDLLMHHTAQPTCQQVQAHIPFFEPLVLAALPAEAKREGRGRPQQLSWVHLWFRLIFGVLTGMSNYQQVRRDLAQQALGPFPCLQITDDALIKRLKQAGVAPLQEILTRLSLSLGPLLTSLCPCTLAPFASGVFALDETTWDAIQRHLPALRALPNGDVGLLPGKLAGRFNIRTQQWDFVQFRDDPQANCKLDLCSLLDGLPFGALLLFDLGYFSFAFFDYLCQRHFWFISRLREDVCYQIAHTFYRHEGVLDALVWLGAASRNSSRCGHLVRLVRFWDGQHLRTYLTNQLDPMLLPLPDVARLYARRWDIELAFLTLKEHLGLHHWWSGLPVLRQQQALLVLIAAQLLHALRLLIAAEQGCDPFEVSLPLLADYLPTIIATRQHPVTWVCTSGPALDFFRPSSRCQIIAPDPALHAYRFPPPALPHTRLARYQPCPARPHRPARKTPRRKPGQAKPAPLVHPPKLRQLPLFSSRQLRCLSLVD